MVTAHAGGQRVFSTDVELEKTTVENQYLVEGRVTELKEGEDEIVEELISAPRMIVIVGKKAKISDLGDTQVSVEVTWPTNAKGETQALIVVTQKQDKKLLSRSKVTIELEKE